MRPDSQVIMLGDIPVELIRKKIKHLRLVVSAPDGRVRLSVPLHVPMRHVQLFLNSRLDWVRDNQARFAALPGFAPGEMKSGETHYLLGEPCTLQVRERPGRNEIIKSSTKLLMYVKPGAGADRRRRLLDEYYRAQLGILVPGLLEHWQPLVGRKVTEWRIRKMKTRWGSCNIDRKRIWLNLELAKQPINCIEYVLVHELVHLLERRHDQRFREHMGRLMPDWFSRSHKLENTLPGYAPL